MPLITDLGFSRHHRRDAVDIQVQFPETNQLFPDLGFTDDKIETMSVDKLITGTIRSQQITLGITDTRGDVYIAGGTFDVAAWTATNGFILGLDDSASNREKFYLGNATNWIDWNVTTANTLTIAGVLVAGEIHIPDRDTTTNSFHVNTTGNLWIGATETDFNASANNAEFYVLNTGAMRVGTATDSFDWNITTANTFTIFGRFNLNLTGSRARVLTTAADGDVGMLFNRTVGGDPDMFLTYWGQSDLNTLALTEENARGVHVRTDGRVVISGIVPTTSITGATAMLEVVQQASFTSGSALRVYRDSAAAATNSPLVSLIQDNVGDDQAVLHLRQDSSTGTVPALYVEAGRVGIGISAPTAQLAIDQPSTTGAIPVLYLDQADVSEEFIRFIGTSANAVLTQSIVENADVAVSTLQGWLKVFVQDDGNQIADGAYYIPIYTLA